MKADFYTSGFSFDTNKAISNFQDAEWNINDEGALEIEINNMIYKFLEFNIFNNTVNIPAQNATATQKDITSIFDKRINIQHIFRVKLIDEFDTDLVKLINKKQNDVYMFIDTQIHQNNFKIPNNILAVRDDNHNCENCVFNLTESCKNIVCGKNNNLAVSLRARNDLRSVYYIRVSNEIMKTYRNKFPKIGEPFTDYQIHNKNIPDHILAVRIDEKNERNVCENCYFRYKSECEYMKCTSATRDDGLNVYFINKSPV